MTKTLRIGIDGWVTVQVKALEGNEFVSELLYGGHFVDDCEIIHVQSNATSENGRCGWYAARRLIRDHTPKGKEISVRFGLNGELDDYHYRNESALSREITDIGLPDVVERWLLEHSINTLRDLLTHYNALDERARNPLPRFFAQKTRRTPHPLGRKRMNLVRLKLREIGMDRWVGYDFHHPDVDTRLLVAERFAER